MESQTDQIESLFEKTKRYTQTSIELYKLKFIDKSADVVSTFAARVVVGLLAILFILMVNIGAALWLGDILGKHYYGFLLVSAFYGVAAVVFYVMRHKWIKSSVRNLIIEQSIR
jgi:hypothetical protein